MLATIAKHVTTLYKDTELNPRIVKLCGEAADAIKELQSFIGAARRNFAVREALGTCLSLPTPTRWASTYVMVTSYIKSKDQILTTLQKLSSTLATRHTELLTDYVHIFEAYIRVLEPVAKFITKLEVISF
jgi:hypothetical protein